METINHKTTANWLEEYIGDILSKFQIDATFGAFAMEYQFGSEIHADIDGFCKFAQGNNSTNKVIKRDTIRETLTHDLFGALNKDKGLLPRVDGYGKYVEEHLQ